jgi:hypothetical protein
MENNTASATENPTAFFSLAKSPLKFRLFLLQQLPAAYFSGVRVVEVDEEKAEVVIPYKWFTRNPFRSTYFACLNMAGEMSTGLLAMAQLYRREPKLSMLVVAVDGKFHKKAVGRTKFICKEGQAIKKIIRAAVDTGEAQTIRALSSGFNDAGELVAECWVTWSFKRKGG